MSDRESAALDTVSKYSRWAVAGGLIPIPLIDIATVTGLQIKMLSEVSATYDVSFAENRAKSLISALLGGIVPHNLSWGLVGSLVKGIPFYGTAVGLASMSVFSGASTYAVGRVFVQHFESGGTFIDFSPALSAEAFRKHFEEGKTKQEAASTSKRSTKKAAASA